MMKVLFWAGFLLPVALAETPQALRAAIEHARYRIQPRAHGGYRAGNATNRFVVEFSGRDTAIHTDSDAHATLSLVGYGWGAAINSAGPATGMEASGDRLVRRYGDSSQGSFKEWFENTPLGLEQGFVLARRGETARGPLRIRLAAEGGWRVEAGGDGVRLKRGETTLNYGGLKAWDAAGTVLESRLRATDAGIEIEVDDATAVYPVTVDPTFTQIFTQEQEIFGASSSSSYDFGKSLSLSSDGNTALVGAPSDEGGPLVTGAAYVFTRSNGAWTQAALFNSQDPSLLGAFAEAVALSADGMTALVGDPYYNSYTGAVFSYFRSGQTWTQGPQLAASGIGAQSLFGFSLALSSDGATALVGAGSANQAAYVFTRSGASWNEQAMISLPTVQSNSPVSVSVSADGNTALLGSFQQESAYVFTRSGTTWSEQQKLTAPDGAPGDYFGAAVALSSDGNTGLVTADSHNNSNGAAYIFVRSGTNWSLQQEIAAADSNGALFGTTASLSADGNTALIGAEYQGGQYSFIGSAYWFSRSGSAWTQMQELRASDAAKGEFFGHATAISGDGTTGLVGAFGYGYLAGNKDAGAVYAYSRKGSFGSVNVQQAAAATTITFVALADEVLGTPQVLTSGAGNQDYTLAGGTCAGAALGLGSTCTVSVNFKPAFAGTRLGAVNLVDNNGNVLFTSPLQGEGVGPQLAFGPGAPSMFASGAQGASAVAVDGLGNVYFIESSSAKVWKYAAGQLQQIASGLPSPAGLAVDGAGNLYIADWHTYAIYKVPAGGTAATLAFGGAPNPQSVAVDGFGNIYAGGYFPATTTSPQVGYVLKFPPDFSTYTFAVFGGLFDPTGLAFDSAGDLFVADTFYQLATVYKYPAASGAQTVVAGGFVSVAAGIAADAAGDVFVTDTLYQRIWELPANGTAKFTVGTGFQLPYGLALNAGGDLFVADSALTALVELNRSQAPALSFAATASGSTAGPLSFTIENIGNVNLTPSKLSVNGEFAQVAGGGAPVDCSGSLGLAPGAYCNVSIDFAPVTGGSATGSVVLTGNQYPAKETVAALSGTGNGPGAMVSAKKLSMGSEPVGTPSPAQFVTVKNVGNANLTITAIGTTGDFAQTNNCPVSPAQLAAGAKCKITLTFTPTLPGVRKGTLTITDNANTTATGQTVSLTGTGTTYQLTIAPNPVTVTHGQSVGTNATLTPVDGFMGTVSLVCDHPGAGGLTCTPSPNPVPVSGGPAISTITLGTTANTPPGTYSLFLQSMSGAIAHKVPFTLVVQ